MPRRSPLQRDDLFGEARPEGALDLDVGGVGVHFTSLERTYFPATGQTKADLLRYYHAVAPVLLPHLRGRPLILKRYPEGAGGDHFFQHEAGDVPPFVRTAHLEAESGRLLHYVVGGDEATLLYLASRGAIECHAWHSTVDTPDEPDRLVLDLDPGAGVGFAAICRLALAVRAVLAEDGLVGYPKTSGSRGLHVFVPIAPGHGYDRAAAVALDVARKVVEAEPALATLERAPEARPAGTIYVDHLQNARGKTVVAPYSVRARPGATVSMPLTWAEVEAVPDPSAFTMATVPARLAAVGDVFGPVLSDRQNLR